MTITPALRAETPASYAARHRALYEDGVARLLGSLADPVTTTRPVATVVAADDEALLDFLHRAEYLTIEELALGDNPSRVNIRSLAALFPGSVGFSELASRMHLLIGSKHLSVDDIAWILAGHRREVDIASVQFVGDLLRQGKTIASTAEVVGISQSTVRRIESLCGIRAAVAQDQLDDAIVAVRDGVSVRQLAARLNVTRHQAHALTIKARSVLAELDENPTNPTTKENHDA